MSNLKIDHFVVGPVQTNCYFAVNKETKEMIIIDPGAAAKKLSEKIKENEYKPVAILLNHAHFDHASAAEELADEYGIKIYVHEDDKETLTDVETNASWMIQKPEEYRADVFLKDEQEIDLAGFHIRVLHTPGHTPGGCCYYFAYENVVFTGDSLFCGSIGRTDFKKGSMSDLVRSVKEKLLTLPENTDVFPGHNDFTTIENERMYNPYL